MTLTFGSLFSGIGGMDLGLERAGMVCKWQVEIDPFCRKVLAKHWPDVPKWDDVKTFPPEGDWQVDLIAGGFPCQPVSLAGKGKAQDDERWLWPEFARVLRLLGPQFALLENVPGLLVRGFGDVLRDMAELGYDAEWGVFPAAAFGACHLRKRVFIVAYHPGSRRKQEGCQRQESKEARHSPGRLANGGEATPDLDGKGRTIRQEQVVLAQFPAIERNHWWATEPNMVRVVHGFPGRVDRIRGLGNAVVPQVAEWIGRRIMEATP